MNNDLGFWVDNYYQVQKLRIATSNRIFDYKTRKIEANDETETLFQNLKGLEKFLDKSIKTAIKGLPIYEEWLKKIKGLAHCLSAQLVCAVGTVADEKKIDVVDGEKKGVRIVRACPSISSLWKYAGFGNIIDNKAVNRKKGEKIAYNIRLKTICWKIAKSIVKTGGGSIYEQLYRQYKKHYEGKYRDEKDKEKGWKGHQDNRAIRKMIKIFLSHLWIVWRQLEGLEVRKPYVIEILDHPDFIQPPFWKEI